MDFIDVHCHLDSSEFDNDLDSVLNNAKNLGVIKIISSALNIDSINKTFKIIERYPNFVYLTACCDYTILDEKIVNEITEYIIKIKDKIVGIGEAGLDFYIYRNEALKEKNIKIFKHWINLAINLDLPLVVHSRSAGKYAIKILIQSGIKKVIMHAFDGSVGYGIEGSKNGFYFSIPPSIVRSEQKQKLVKHLPLENILLESDSPVLGPDRNIRNTPSNVTISAAKIAEIKKIPLGLVSTVTTKNALTIFNL